MAKYQHDRSLMPPATETKTGDAPAASADLDDGLQSLDPRPYHPSKAFRRLLGRVRRAQPGTSAEARDRPAEALTAPGLLPLLGTTLGVGVAAGVLEFAVLMTQLHGLHRIGLTTLRMSRHVAWMVPVAETLVTTGLALVFLLPALASAAWRRRRRRQSGAVPPSAEPIWNWAGSVLGTLFFLGPVLAIRGLHAGPALALALGAGVRCRRWVVRPTRWWQRGAYWAGGLAALILPAYALGQYSRLTHAEARAWSQPAPEAPSLLWIVMDTVRADRMSFYGYPRPTTPELAEWAQRGITFDMARSGAPWTLASHLTMFTGLWPFEHGARIDRPYHGAAPTLAEHLGAQGYTTAGFVGNAGMCNAYFGTGRGFDHYVDNPFNHEVSLRATVLNSALGDWVLKLARMAGLPAPKQFPAKARIAAPEVIAWAQSWFGRVQERNAAASPVSRRPYFLFLNFVDAHGPYLPLPTSPRVFTSGPLPPRGKAVPETGWLAVQARNAASPEQRAEGQEKLDGIIQLLGDLYDDCLHGLDAELGRFLRDLRARGLLENTWIVITSDHGEHFGEHDIFGHGGSLYNELTHVPLVLIPPLPRAGEGQGRSDDPAADLRGGRIGAPVSQRDLPVTMAGLLLPGSHNPFLGRSLARYWSPDGPGPQAPDPILSQLEEQPLEGKDVQSERVIQMDSVLDEAHLLIQTNGAHPELYDLFGDPKQQQDLASQPSERRRQERLKRTLDRILQGADRH